MTGRFSALALVGAGIVGALALLAILAPVVSPYSPQALSGPPLQPPSVHHLLGTNNLGQDILSQLIWGARPSLSVAVGAATLALLLGVVFGVGAAVLGGVVELVVMRVVDVFLALPLLPLLILVAALVGAHAEDLVLVIGLMSWPATARVLRSQTLSLRGRGFVQAAKGFGRGPSYVVRRHLVPALGPLLVSGFVAVAAHAVLLEAGLAFLGLSDPTSVTWGLVLNEALLQEGAYFSALWTWWALPAGLAVTLAVLGFTFIGIGVEHNFNPRWERA